MNNNNPPTKIVSIIEQVFENSNIKERDKLIVKKYYHLDGETLRMRELGDEYGITKEAVRIILEKNRLKVESNASKVAAVFDLLAKETLKLAPVSLERLNAKMQERGYDISGLCEKGVVSAIAMFSRKHKESVMIDSVGGRLIICDASKPEAAKDIERIARSESSKNGYASTSTVTSKVNVLYTTIKSSSVIDILSCLDEASWVSKRFVTFIDSRNRIISRVKKIASVKDTVSAKRACDAINQSISHRDKNYSSIEVSMLIKLISLCYPTASIDKGIIVFEGTVSSQANDIELEIYELLAEKGSMELLAIESHFNTKHSKASIYQSCSLSPLILKKGKFYSVV